MTANPEVISEPSIDPVHRLIAHTDTHSNHLHAHHTPLHRSIGPWGGGRWARGRDGRALGCKSCCAVSVDRHRNGRRAIISDGRIEIDRPTSPFLQLTQTTAGWWPIIRTRKRRRSTSRLGVCQPNALLARMPLRMLMPPPRAKGARSRMGRTGRRTTRRRSGSGRGWRRQRWGDGYDHHHSI